MGAKELQAAVEGADHARPHAQAADDLGAVMARSVSVVAVAADAAVRLQRLRRFVGPAFGRCITDAVSGLLAACFVVRMSVVRIRVLLILEVRSGASSHECEPRGAAAENVTLHTRRGGSCQSAPTMP